MPKITLYGTAGAREIFLPAPTPRQTPVPKTTTPVQSTATAVDVTSLTPTTVMQVIQQMPHRWLNVDEIVIQLKSVHKVACHAREVEAVLRNAPVQWRRWRNRTEVRHNDANAADVHRKSCFACVRELKPYLNKLGVSTDELWDAIKKRYGVESRTELDTHQWASLSGELQAAKRNKVLLNYMLN